MTPQQTLEKVIKRAIESLDKTNGSVENHFHDVMKMVSIGYGNP